MNLKTPQKILVALAVVACALSLAAWYAISTIDTKRLVRLVSTEVKAATGRDLSIKGPVSIKLFPHLAVVAEQVSLSNPSWAADPDMVSAKQVSFDLLWRPLFNHQVAIQKVTFDQVQLVLQAAPTTAKVAGSWIFDASTSASQSNQTASPGFGFDLNEMHLNQVSAVYKDAQGTVVDTLMLKRFDGKRVGNKNLIDSAFNWNGLPLTLKGSTDLLLPLIDDWGVKPADFALDLNLGVNKQTAQLQGHINFLPQAAPMLDLTVSSTGIDLQAIQTSLAQGAHRTGSAKSGASNRVFSSELIPFNALPLWQGQIKATVDTLVLPSGIKMDSFSGTMAATPDDALILKPLSFKLGSGLVVADGRLNAMHGARPQLDVRGYASGFNFGHLMAQMGKANLASGGPTEAAFNISGRGTSASALAASANGALQVSVGQASVSNSIVALGGDFLLNVANVINPLRKSSDTSELQCLVAYLPIKNGLIQINQSVGMRTDRLDITLDGQVNLGPESLLINIHPKERSGLTTGVNPAGLVQITGTLTNPQIGINKMGVVKQATGVGLAIVTGGISLVAQNAVGVVSRSSPCDNVLRPWSQVAGGLTTSP